MVLADIDIKKHIETGDITITPFKDELLRAASYTLTLGERAFKLKKVESLDSRNDTQDCDEIRIDSEKGYTLNPGEFLNILSEEKITLSDKVCVFLSTRGSRAQQGLHFLLSSLFVEPGSDNHMALEVQNITPMPIVLYPGIKAVKCIFMSTHSKADQKGRGKDFLIRNELEK